MASSKLNTGIICCDIDHLDRIVQNFEKIKDRIWVDKECSRSAVIDLIKDIGSIQDQVEYFKEVNRDNPRIQKKDRK
jgi:hypothetical protein